MESDVQTVISFHLCDDGMWEGSAIMVVPDSTIISLYGGNQNGNS